MAYTPMTTGAGSGQSILRPEQVGEMLVTAVGGISVAMQVATIVTTGSHDYRIPITSADGTAGWFAEGAEITPSNPTLDEEVVTPSKVAGLSIISRELADDSSPAAAEAVGQSLARDIARKIDSAFFGATVANGPSGIESLTTSTATETATAWATADPFVDAIYTAAGQGATITAFVANATDAKVLATLKQSSTSNVPLLTPDPTQPIRSLLAGVPLLVSPAVTAGSVWAIPIDRVFIVIRDGANVEVDRSVKFTSDQVAVKATMRVGIGWPQPLGIVKITHGV